MKNLRSEAFGPLLLVPADRPDRVADAARSGARTVAFDLRGVDAAALPAARAAVSEALQTANAGERRPRILVAIHSLASGLAETDVAALSPHRPDAVLLPRAEDAADIQHLGALLAVEEAKAGLADGSIGIAALAETGAALFSLITLSRASPRLTALAWDGESLARDLGADDAREPGGRWTDPCQTARTLALSAAADAGLPAIDGPFSSADLNGFTHEAERARRDGFSGKLCLNPAQAEIAGRVFAGP